MANYEVQKIGLRSPDLHSAIHIAIANMPVLDDHIKASYLGRPVRTLARIEQFNVLLNAISVYRGYGNKKVDLLVFPEVSLPHSWKPMIVKWAHQRYIGVVCGLEHRLVQKTEQGSVRRYAYNELLCVLPFRSADNHKDCMVFQRLKRWYSPHEQFLLENNNLSVPNNQLPHALIRWRGASFAVYNCYEMANIEDRGIFKGKVDFIVVSEWNPDTNYFANVVESAARDLHCYVVQVNNSKFGDSRVVYPSKTDRMSPVKIKGGDNVTFLAFSLDLEALREHQRTGYGLQKESDEFKPTPPGLNIADVPFRIDLGGKAS